MRNIRVIAKRELRSYFSTPLAYVFIVIFLALTGAFTFYIGQFFGRGQADLGSFFGYHPWLYLLLVPAVAMRLWAEERKTGTVEQLMTLPISTAQAVLGKFFAAWAFIGLALVLTFPMWITVNLLGDPDNGVVLASYLGSLVMAGAFLAIGSCISALTKNQVVAFVITTAVCFVLIASGAPIVLGFFSGWAPKIIVEFIASLSFLTHFADVSKGVLDLRDVIYFLSLIAVFLFANMLAVDRLKAE